MAVKQASYMSGTIMEAVNASHKAISGLLLMITASMKTVNPFLKMITAIATVMKIQKTILKKLETSWCNMSKGKNSVMLAQLSILTLVLASWMNCALLHCALTPREWNLS